MLKVYGYMSVGLGITGVVAWLFANAFVAQNPLVVSLMQPPMAYIVMFAPLGIILWMSFGINRMSARTSQNFLDFSCMLWNIFSKYFPCLHWCNNS